MRTNKTITNLILSGGVFLTNQVISVIFIYHDFPYTSMIVGRDNFVKKVAIFQPLEITCQKTVLQKTVPENCKGIFPNSPNSLVE